MSFRFINHACIEVDFGEGTLVTDPWFFGRVFNESWELMVEGGDIDYARIRYIWISHEHPDHLHFPTLRSIREQAPQPITVLFREQKDKSVVKAIAALGYEVRELEQADRVELSTDLAITCYPNRADSALLIESGGQRIFNQNDCRLPLNVVGKIGAVDAWLFQFSHAGYAGNEGDEAALMHSSDAYGLMVKRYADVLLPRIYIPFASFIRFCHPLNAFLNRWRVTPATIASLGLPCEVRVLKPGDGIDGEGGAEWWNTRLMTEIAPAPLRTMSDADLIKVGQRFCTAIRKGWPRHAVPEVLSIELAPTSNYAVLGLRSGVFSISDSQLGPLVAKLDAQSLAFLLRFPWGADTIHIAGVATVIDRFRWQWLLYIKHVEYKLARFGRLRTLIPLPLAWLVTKRKARRAKAKVATRPAS